MKKVSATRALEGAASRSPSATGSGSSLTRKPTKPATCKRGRCSSLYASADPRRHEGRARRPAPSPAWRAAKHSQGRGARGCADAEADMPSAEASGAICVQRFDGSRNSAIHTTYRISLRSSSIREPRYPLLRVVIGCERAERADRHDASA